MNAISNISFGSLFNSEKSKIKRLKTTKAAINFTPLLRGLPHDTFSPEIVETHMPGTYGTPDIIGRRIKSIALKDTKGNDIPGFIIQEIEDENSYYACTKKCALCEMNISRAHPFGTGYIFINSLYGQSNNGEVKGAGTELIKLAIEKSKATGCDGRLELSMAGSYPFYFKNNFRAGRGYSDYLRKDAVLDYMTRHKLIPEMIWKKKWDSINVILDEKGAKALLKGERFFDTSTSETMYSKNIEYQGKDGKTCTADIDIDFCDFSKSDIRDGTFVIQTILKKEGNYYFPLADLEMQLLEDENGDKYLEAENIRIEELKKDFEKAIIDEMFEAAAIKAKELGAKYIRKDFLNIIRS